MDWIQQLYRSLAEDITLLMLEKDKNEASPVLAQLIRHLANLYCRNCSRCAFCMDHPQTCKRTQILISYASSCTGKK